MRDEEYAFFQDVREKKVTGYSARKQRSHCGKAGCKLPSDYLSKKELKNMSGECKSYRLNEPMTFAEFKSMPDDLQTVYVKALREKYNAPDMAIARMMGTTKDAIYFALKKLGLTGSKKGHKKWDEKGFNEWCYGIPQKEEIQSAQEEEPVTVTEEVEKEVIEEETPVVEEVPCQDTSGRQAECESVAAFKKCIPATGSMTYEGLTFNILSSLADLLGNANVVLSVKWDVVED